MFDADIRKPRQVLMILVTGASGLVGGNMVRALLAAGKPVRAIVRDDQRAIAGLDVETVQADVRDLDSLLRACQGVEVVFHLAGAISLEMNSWDMLDAVNVQGTRNVVEACLRSGVRRMVHFSSIHALVQEPLDTPVDENRALIDDSHAPPYDRSKALTEREVQAGIARGLDAVTLNPTAMLGPHDYKPSYLGRAVTLMARGRLPALVSGGFDWVDVRDVVDGAVRAAESAPCGARYLLGGHWHSVREMAERVAAVSGRRAALFTVPIGLARAFAPLMLPLARFTGGEPLYTQVSLRALDSNHHVLHARAARELGYQSRPFAETVRDAVTWFAENGYL